MSLAGCASLAEIGPHSLVEGTAGSPL
jgi:hypothetical protein